MIEDAKLSSLSEIASPNADAGTEDNLGLEEATGRTDTYGPGSPNEIDHGADVSVKPPGEGSVISVASIVSSATDLSRVSVYSAVQIATATREVLSVLRGDRVLLPLYTPAIFRYYFRGKLEAFADRLKDEARDRSDILAAFLVALKAREISEAILERYRLWKAPTLDTEEGKETTTLGKDDRNSSDEDEQEERNMDETILEELTNTREFLVQSAAFKLLRADMQSFTSSKQPSIERQVDVAVRSMESTVEYDCVGMLKEDLPLLQLHLHALLVLGKDRFLIEYSRLLCRYYGDTNMTTDSSVAGSARGDADAQPTTKWSLVASNILLHLETTDAKNSHWKDQNPDTKAETGFSFRTWLTGITPLHLLSTELALLTLRRPLRELLAQIPGYLVELSSVNDVSFVNRTKAFIEDYTTAEWDWWPLAPRVPDIARGECRLQWKVRFLSFMSAGAMNLNHAVWRSPII